MSEATCITKAREHCAKFQSLKLEDTSTVFLQDGDGTVWRVSHLLAEYDAAIQRAEAAEARRREIDDEAFAYAEQIEVLRKTILTPAHAAVIDAAVEVVDMINDPESKVWKFDQLLTAVSTLRKQEAKPASSEASNSVILSGEHHLSLRTLDA